MIASDRMTAFVLWLIVRIGPVWTSVRHQPLAEGRALQAPVRLALRAEIEVSCRTICSTFLSGNAS